MKLKTLSLAAGVLALTLTTTTFAAQAQTRRPSVQQIAQNSGQELLQKLALTNAQKTKIQTINRKAGGQIIKVLTPAQQTKLKNAIQSGQSQSQAFASLNLTNQQKSQIQQIVLSSRKEIQGILTPKQLQQIKQFEENVRLRRSQGNPQ
ncbi:hypothetical protein NIES4074_56300 [Cylindrospermum sp. NIES-4074]|nr:hypothetical protein NIES4074_56300 [Cylindrospermum sp. NIES-4074]